MWFKVKIILFIIDIVIYPICSETLNNNLPKVSIKHINIVEIDLVLEETTPTTTRRTIDEDREIFLESKNEQQHINRRQELDYRNVNYDHSNNNNNNNKELFNREREYEERDKIDQDLNRGQPARKAYPDDYNNNRQIFNTKGTADQDDDNGNNFYDSKNNQDSKRKSERTSGFNNERENEERNKNNKGLNQQSTREINRDYEKNNNRETLREPDVTHEFNREREYDKANERNEGFHREDGRYDSQDPARKSTNNRDFHRQSTTEKSYRDYEIKSNSETLREPDETNKRNKGVNQKNEHESNSKQESLRKPVLKNEFSREPEYKHDHEINQNSNQKPKTVNFSSDYNKNNSRDLLKELIFTNENNHGSTNKQTNKESQFNNREPIRNQINTASSFSRTPERDANRKKILKQDTTVPNRYQTQSDESSNESKSKPKSQRGKTRRICETKYSEYIERIYSNDDETIADANDSEFDGRVLASPGEYPHMTALGFRLNDNSIDYQCGGSLISENFVITAAHCTNFTGLVPTIARIGDINLMRDEKQVEPQIYSIRRIYVHPKYDGINFYNDIALLQLNTSVEFTEFVRPIKLWSHTDLPFAKAFAMGYGATSFDRAPTQQLTDFNMTIIPNNECNERLPHLDEVPHGIIESQICAEDLIMHRDTCQGDSGGPLQYNICGRRRRNRIHYQLIGITSFGLLCRSPNPGVYTRIYSFLDWIENTVWIN